MENLIQLISQPFKNREFSMPDSSGNQEKPGTKQH